MHLSKRGDQNPEATERVDVVIDQGMSAPAIEETDEQMNEAAVMAPPSTRVMLKKTGHLSVTAAVTREVATARAVEESVIETEKKRCEMQSALDVSHASLEDAIGAHVMMDDPRDAMTETDAVEEDFREGHREGLQEDHQAEFSAMTAAREVESPQIRARATQT